jgi:hypothetical protein
VRQTVLLSGFLCLYATAAEADQLTLKNGDRLTGTIVKSDAKTLLLKTDFAGDINLQWDAVTSIVSSQSLHLALKDGQTIVGTVTTTDSKFEVATKETGPVAAAKDAVVSVRNDAEQKAYDDQIDRLRNVVGGGLGYHVISTKATTFDLFAGGDYDQDYFGAIAATATTPAKGAVTRKNGEVDLGETFNAKINNRTTLTEQLSLFPNVSDTGSYRFQFDATAATKLKNWLSWQVTYSDRYLSDPLAGFKKNDVILSTGVRLTFGKGAF